VNRPFLRRHAPHRAGSSPGAQSADADVNRRASPGSNQSLLRAFGVHAKLTVSQPSDPDEVEENPKDLNAPLAPDLSTLRPLTTAEKEEFIRSLDDSGRQLLADLG